MMFWESRFSCRTIKSKKINTKIVHHFKSQVWRVSMSDLTPQMYRDVQQPTIKKSQSRGVRSNTAACCQNNYCFNLVSDWRLTLVSNKDNASSLPHSHTGILYKANNKVLPLWGSCGSAASDVAGKCLSGSFPQVAFGDFHPVSPPLMTLFKIALKFICQVEKALRYSEEGEWEDVAPDGKWFSMVKKLNCKW